MSKNEIGLREARAQLGDLANRAHLAGDITYLMRNGRRIAAIVPVNLVPVEQSMTVTLYETNSDILVMSRGDNAWSMGAPSGDYLAGTFTQDAEAWIDGDWEPSEGDGQTPTTLDGLTRVAEWSSDGLRVLVRRDQLGGAARTYLGPTTYTLSLIEGDAGRSAVGDELNESPIAYTDLDKDTVAWLDENGFDVDHPDRWVLVTPVNEHPNAANVIASRDVTI